jgi:voltage-gated potassium channel
MMIKKKVFNLVVKGSHGSKLNLYFDYFIMTLILLSVVSIILETIPDINSSFGNILIGFNAFSIIIFTIEYLLRIYVSDLTYPSSNRLKSAFKFIFSGYGIIDLLAILPFYLPFFIKIDLRFIRVIRLIRFFRVLKINRYNKSLSLIAAVIREKKTELAITGFVALLIILLASFAIYHVEGHVQPDKFPNVIASLWWAIATLTTVGYGDVYPVTAIGKVISGVIAVLGIGLVALPTGIIGAGFMEQVDKQKKKKKCPHCGKDINY